MFLVKKNLMDGKKRPRLMATQRIRSRKALPTGKIGNHKIVVSRSSNEYHGA